MRLSPDQYLARIKQYLGRYDLFIIKYYSLQNAIANPDNTDTRESLDESLEEETDNEEEFVLLEGKLFHLVEKYSPKKKIEKGKGYLNVLETIIEESGRKVASGKRKHLMRGLKARNYKIKINKIIETLSLIS